MRDEVLAMLLTAACARAVPPCQPVQLQTLDRPPSEVQPFFEFGFSMDVDGDVAVVGSSTLATAAYVFRRTNGVWQFEATLTGTGVHFLDAFAQTVAVDGDVIAIGSPNARCQTLPGGAFSCEGRGLVYVYRHTASGWHEEAILEASDAQNGSVLGFNGLDIDGNRIMVGAPSDGGFNRGAAYVFDYDGEQWSQQAKIVPPDNEVFDFFSGDVVLDGSTALISAPGDDPDGSVYVYQFDGSTWNLQTKLAPDTTNSNAGFGSTVALDPTTGRVAIAAGSEPVSGSIQVGVVYLFERSGQAWNRIAKLVPDNPIDNLNMGVGFPGVAIRNDLVLVGAQFDDPQGGRHGGSGSAYLFGFDGTSWTQRAKVIDPTAVSTNTDNLGSSVAFVGPEQVLIGVPGDDLPQGEEVGTVRLFDLNCSACAPDLTGSADPNDPGFGVPDGILDANDFFFFLTLFASGDPAADLTGSIDPNDPSFGIPDGTIDANDFFFYLDLFSQGCP